MKKGIALGVTLLGLTAFSMGASACPFMDQTVKITKPTTVATGGMTPLPKTGS
ncbi:MAG: hypothetical protein QNJ84_15780 [Alphaproteobacteria bacterium]|nr:hypothetical protein [Alphaproteobacteria bacterium]